MEGLISEGAEVAKAKGDGDARDAALIGAAQRVEHYEIAAYGTARTLAQQLGHTEAADLLSQTLDEESAADEKLTAIATSSGERRRSQVADSDWRAAWGAPCHYSAALRVTTGSDPVVTRCGASPSSSRGTTI